jgi:dCTP deaminase
VTGGAAPTGTGPGYVLNHLEILERLSRGDRRRLVVRPLLDLQQQLGLSSLDVRLGTEFRVFQRQQYPYLDPLKQEEQIRRDVQDYTSPIVLPIGRVDRPFVLHPGEFVLASTLEYIILPPDLTARLDGRSSWGRIGLQVHSTAGNIDPGYRGTITYELANVGKVPTMLLPGLRVAQLTFHPIAAVMKEYDAERKYFEEVGPAPSSFYLDREFERWRRIRLGETTGGAKAPKSGVE